MSPAVALSLEQLRTAWGRRRMAAKQDNQHCSPASELLLDCHVLEKLQGAWGWKPLEISSQLKNHCHPSGTHLCIAQDLPAARAWHEALLTGDGALHVPRAI